MRCRKGDDIVRNKKWPIWPLALLAVVTGLLMGVGAVWVTDEVLMFALGVAPVALTAWAIVAYYELQTNRQLRMRDTAKPTLSRTKQTRMLTVPRNDGSSVPAPGCGLQAESQCVPREPFQSEMLPSN